MIRIITVIAALLWPLSVTAETLRLAVTTSFNNSGLSDILLPAIKRDTGLEVHLLVVGTGQALRLGEAGDVDAILVHSRRAEEAFIAAGFGTHRREIMYNDFVFIGPDADPAALRTAATPDQAMAALALQKMTFISRGDDSGTHKKELSLWVHAGLDPMAFGPWYKSVGAGMGSALNTASGMGAYVMSDRASWLNFKNKSGLQVVFEGGAALFNQYAYIPVSPKRHPHVKDAATRTLENWLTGDAAKGLINGYRINGEALFTFNAQPAP